jgi:hypothetical protein
MRSKCPETPTSFCAASASRDFGNPKMDADNEFASAIALSDAEIAELKELWRRVLPELSLPGDDQFRLWLKLHAADTVRCGIDRTAHKFRRNGFNAKHCGAAIRFADAVMDSRTYAP